MSFYDTGNGITLSKSTIKHILHDPKYLQLIWDDVYDKVSEGYSDLVETLWNEKFNNTIELIQYCGSLDVRDYDEFEDFVNEMIRETPRYDQSYEYWTGMTLDEMSSVVSVLDGNDVICSLIKKYKSSPNPELFEEILELYHEELDSQDLSREQCELLWEFLHTQIRNDDYLFEKLCIQDRIVNDEDSIHSYVLEKMGQVFSLDEIKEIVQLLLFNEDDSDDSDDYETIGVYEEDEV
jgi:hypothetical protein